MTPNLAVASDASADILAGTVPASPSTVLDEPSHTESDRHSPAMPMLPELSKKRKASDPHLPPDTETNVFLNNDADAVERDPLPGTDDMCANIAEEGKEDDRCNTDLVVASLRDEGDVHSDEEHEIDAALETEEERMMEIEEDATDLLMSNADGISVLESQAEAAEWSCSDKGQETSGRCEGNEVVKDADVPPPPNEVAVSSVAATADVVACENFDGEDGGGQTAAVQQWKRLRERARTLSIDIDRFEVEDMAAYLQDDEDGLPDLSTLTEADLPPLVSRIRSRSASVASTSGLPGIRSRSESVVEAPLSIPDVVPSGTSSHPGELLLTRSQAHSLQGQARPTDAEKGMTTGSGAGTMSSSGSAAAVRDRGFSFEFFSFGIGAEENLPEAPAMTLAPLPETPEEVGSASVTVTVNAERENGEQVHQDTGTQQHLVRNERTHEQSPQQAEGRGEAMIFPAPNGEESTVQIDSGSHVDSHAQQRNRADSIALFELAGSQLQRPRGDSIIFDPSSFGEGGIHEQNALRKLGKDDRGVVTGGGGYLGENGELEIMNSPGLVPVDGNASAPVDLPHIEISNNSATSSGASESVAVVATVVTANHEHVTSAVGSPPNPLILPPKKKLQRGFEGEGTTSMTTTTTVSNAPTSATASAPPPSSGAPLPMASVSSSRCATAISSSQSLGALVIPPSAPAISSTSPSTITVATTTTTTTTPSLLNGINYSMDLLNKDGRIGIYLPEERKLRIARFHSKRATRIWRKRIKYDCRKKLADSRPRIKGRFVRRCDVENNASVTDS